MCSRQLTTLVDLVVFKKTVFGSFQKTVLGSFQKKLFLVVFKKTIFGSFQKNCFW